MPKHDLHPGPPPPFADIRRAADACQAMARMMRMEAESVNQGAAIYQSLARDYQDSAHRIREWLDVDGERRTE